MDKSNALESSPEFKEDIAPPPQEQPMEETFMQMARRRAQHLSVPRAIPYSRQNVVVAFTDAFELIGGVTRLAVWANDNPGDFYRIYSKLLPTESKQDIKKTVNVIVMEGVARSPLDGPAIVDGEVIEQDE